jgi:hypothetical protein
MNKKNLDSVTWSYEDFLLKEMTMVVPLPGDATQLRRFACQLEEELRAPVLEKISGWSNDDVALKLQNCKSGKHGCTFTWECNPPTQIRLLTRVGV